MEIDYSLNPIGFVRSPLKEPAEAPMQGNEGAPAARLELKQPFAAALSGLAVGDEIIVITWLHRARRETLQVHPRDDPARPLTGVFATRSPGRPNPLGLHPVTILAIDGTTIKVRPLEAIDGTPILDIKPALK